MNKFTIKKLLNERKFKRSFYSEGLNSGATAFRQACPHHGHAENQRSDKEDGWLALTLPHLMECVEEICPAYDP